MPPKSKAKAKGKAEAAKHAGVTKKDSLMELGDKEKDHVELKLLTYEEAMKMTPTRIGREIDLLMTEINKAKLAQNHMIHEISTTFATLSDTDLEAFKKFKPPKKIDMSAEAPIIGLVLTMQVCCFLLTGEDYMNTGLEATMLELTTDRRLLEKMNTKLNEVADTGHLTGMDHSKMKELTTVYQRPCFNPNGVGTLIPVAKHFCKWVLTMCEAYFEADKREQRASALKALKKAREDLLATVNTTETGEPEAKWKASLFKFKDAGSEEMQKMLENLQQAEDEATELMLLHPAAYVQVSLKINDPGYINPQNAEVEQARIRSMLAAALGGENVRPEDVFVTFKGDGVSAEIRVIDSSVGSIKNALDKALADRSSPFYTGQPESSNVEYNSASVKCVRPTDRILKIIKAKHDYDLQEQGLHQIMQAVDNVAKQYHEMLQKFQETESDGMAELLSLPSKGTYEGKLQSHIDAHNAGLGEDWMTQPANSIKDLVELAKKAQQQLKKSVLRDTTWAKTEMNDLSLVPLTAQKRLSSYEYHSEPCLAFDPGVKTAKKIEDKAKHLMQKGFHLNPPYEQVRDIARIGQSYDTVNVLVSAVKDIELGSDSTVVSIENHFKTPTGFGYPHVNVGLQVDGTICERRLSLREIPTPEEHFKEVHDLLAAQHVKPEHFVAVTRTIFEEFDRTEGEDMRHADQRAAELHAAMEPVESQIKRTGLLDSQELEDVKKWVASCQVRPAITDIKRALQSGDLNELERAVAAAEKLQELRNFYKMDCALLNAEFEKGRKMVDEIRRIEQLMEDVRCCELHGTLTCGPSGRAALLKERITETIKLGILQPWHPAMFRAKALADFLDKLGESVEIDDEIERIIIRQPSTDDVSLSRRSVRRRADQLRSHANTAVSEHRVQQEDGHVTRALTIAREFDILEKVADFMESHLQNVDIDTLSDSLKDIYVIGKTPLLMKLPLPAVRLTTARFRHTSEALLDLHKATAVLDSAAATAKKVHLAPKYPNQRPRAAGPLRRAQLYARLREMEARLGAQAEETYVAEENPILSRAKTAFGNARETLKLISATEE